ncbi:MAG: hypothetical protein ACI88C_000041 [Acidimicrobiales bacterium]|jgi:hypothetical protein
MAAEFSFRRSIYQPWLDTTSSSSTPNYEIRETPVNVGQHGGNFWNWTGGVLDVETLYSDQSVIPTAMKPVVGDISDPTAFYQHPMRASWASVEIYIRAFFGGSAFYQITNIHMIATRLDLSGYGDGAYVNGRMADNYPTGDPDLAYVNPDGAAGPVWRPNTAVGSSPAPMQQSQDPDAGFLDLTPGDGIGVEGYSRYGILQLNLGENPLPGEGGGCDFALYYDES